MLLIPSALSLMSTGLLAAALVFGRLQPGSHVLTFTANTSPRANEIYAFDVQRALVFPLTQHGDKSHFALSWSGDGTRLAYGMYDSFFYEQQLFCLLYTSPGHGVGSALIDAVKQAAAAEGAKRLWLITTNDNTPALRFYQKRGFRLAALYPNALAASRKLKPEIPLFGLDGIPLRDEIELEMLL